MTAVSTPPAQSSPARVRTADRLRTFGREQRPSLIVGGVFGLFLLLIAIRLPWADDLMLHMTVLRRLIADPLHPGNPVLDIGGSSIYYSPYMFVLAMAGKVTGLGVYSLYKFAAVVNVALLLTGLYRFVRTLSDARWAPPLALIGLLFWWGTFVIAWSGFLSLVSLVETEAYPSTLATALTLHLWAWLNRRDTLGGLRRTGLLGALLGVILLIHQFTGMSAVVGCAAILVSRHRDIRELSVRRGTTALAAGLVACIAVIAVWPYYHLWDVNQGQLDVLDPVHRALYKDAFAWYGAGLILGLAAIAYRWWRDKTDALVLLFLGTGAIVLYGKLTGHWSYGRSWPAVMLAGQLAAAITAAEAVRGRARAVWLSAVALVTALGVWTQSSGLLYVLPSSWQSSLAVHGTIKALPHLDWLSKYLGSHDVVAASGSLAQYEVAAHGAYNVTSPWYQPEISAQLGAVRDKAEQTIFADTSTASATSGATSAATSGATSTATSGATVTVTEAERVATLEKYDVKWVLLSPGQRLPTGFPARLTAEGSGYRLYQVTVGS